AADRDEGVRARGEDVGNDVLELARLVPTEGETGADVLALGPHPGPAEGLAQSLQCVHGAGSEGERVALEVRDGHGSSVLSICAGSHPAVCNILHTGQDYNGFDTASRTSGPR